MSSTLAKHSATSRKNDFEKPLITHQVIARILYNMAASSFSNSGIFVITPYVWG